MTAFPPFPTDDYRLINASVPLCLLDARDGGDAQSGALAPAVLTIAGGKIRFTWSLAHGPVRLPVTTLPRACRLSTSTAE